MNRILFFICCLLFVNYSHSQEMKLKTLYDFKALTIDGQEFDFSTLKGKKVLIVNTASLCGYTHQYKELEELFQKFGGETFTIIGFPSNDFGEQEPGSNSEIKEFCSKNYGVSFLMMSKISVKGPDMHPLYKWLTEKVENGVSDAEVKWNFQKFLIDAKGHWTGVIAHRESPLCDPILNWIKE